MKAIFDKIIRKAIRNDTGNVIGFEPTNYHYTFGDDKIVGGFYVKVGDEIPSFLKCQSDQVEVSVVVPQVEFTIDIKKGGK